MRKGVFWRKENISQNKIFVFTINFPRRKKKMDSVSTIYKNYVNMLRFEVWRSVFEGPVSRVASITSTDMEEGAACATPVTDVEVLSRTLGSVTLVRKEIHEQQ